MKEGEQMQPSAECPCLAGEQRESENRFVGVDSDYGEVSVIRCKRCGRFWLRYFIEYEYLTASGRWFRGVITPEIAAAMEPEAAKEVLEGLEWYFRGGSAFGGEVIRTAPGQLKYWLFPSGYKA
ncbi:MAG: hypothetical protein M3O35_00350 [Acidobacteriota bacterium]|nr:hypothetical protein [Acidobacteriota bacterium]